MEEKDFLDRLIKNLEEADISYMITGSLASSLYGQPRATVDFDVIIAVAEDKIEKLLSLFSGDYYVSLEAAWEALNKKEMFNIIDEKTGIKADMIFCSDRPFDMTRFARRISGDIFGVRVMVTTPEDIILSKLEWSKKGDSERQFRDALGVALVQGDALDREYLAMWAKELGIADLLEMLYREAGKLR